MDTDQQPDMDPGVGVLDQDVLNPLDALDIPEQEVLEDTEATLPRPIKVLDTIKDPVERAAMVDKAVLTIKAYIFPDDGTVEAEKKATYLSYRACGFTVQEACKMAGTGYKTTKPLDLRTLWAWRNKDPMFALADGHEFLALARKQVSREILEMMYTRNFRLVLQKDFDVMTRAINEPETLTDFEVKYLSKVRSNYTPQQLEVLVNLLSERGAGGGWDWTKMVMEGVNKNGGRVAMMAERNSPTPSNIGILSRLNDNDQTQDGPTEINLSPQHSESAG